MDLPMDNVAPVAAALGAGLAMGLGAIGPGLGLGRVAKAAMRGMNSQPSVHGSLFKNMLIGQAVTETPAIFALVVALLLYTISQDPHLDHAGSLAAAACYLAAGLSVGLGAIGSGIGGGMVAEGGLEAMARVPESRGQVFLYMLMGQAWTQTGVIFALVVSLLLLGRGGFDLLSPADNMVHCGRYFGAALAVGVGSIGPSLGTAMVGQRCCSGLAEYPEAQGPLRNAFFVAAATAQSPCVYALVMALVMIAA